MTINLFKKGNEEITCIELSLGKNKKEGVIFKISRPRRRRGEKSGRST
jgi:hypothetical protein